MESNDVSDSDILDYEYDESEEDEDEILDNSNQPESQDDTCSCVDKDKGDFESAKSGTFTEQPQTSQNVISLELTHSAGSMLIKDGEPHQVQTVQGLEGTFCRGQVGLGIFTELHMTSSTLSQILDDCDCNISNEQNDTTTCANNAFPYLLMNFSGNNTNNVTQVFRAESYFDNTAGSMGFFFHDPDMPLLERVRPLETSSTPQQEAEDDNGGAPTLDYYGPSTEPNSDYYM